MKRFPKHIHYTIFIVAGCLLFATASVLADTGKPTEQQKSSQNSQKKPTPSKKQESVKNKSSIQPETPAKAETKKEVVPISKPSAQKAKATESKPTVKQSVKEESKNPAVQTIKAGQNPETAKAPKPEKPQTTDAAQSQTETELNQNPEGIQINKIILAKGIEEGEPLDPSSIFSLGEDDLFALIYLENPEIKETYVHVSWERIDGPHWRGYALEVPAKKHYRTVARTSMGKRMPGHYKCVVSNEAGIVLDQAEFEITQ